MYKRSLVLIKSIGQIWCRRVTALYENVNILDMDQSWRDGIAFCALIDHFRPGLLGRSVASLETGAVRDMRVASISVRPTIFIRLMR